MKWLPAPDITQRVRYLAKSLDMQHVDGNQLFCFRSTGSSAFRTRARIWSLPKIWQLALNVQASYCIEVLSEQFDRLSADDQERTLIHELLHIPKTFSGALVPHRNAKNRTYRHYHDTVESLFRLLRIKSYQK